MQIRTITIACFLATAVLAGCKKSFLEQSNPNSVSVDANFQTENDIALAVNGVYQALRSSNCIGEGSQTWTDDRSDDINTTDNQSNNGEPFQFTAFALVPSNTYLQSHWNGLYTPISRANLVLSVIDKISFASDDTKNQYIAELKFIRALMYFHLVREFGGVPLVIKRLNNTDEINAATGRASREEVYAQIVTELKEVVASNLPVVQSAAGKKAENLNNAKTYLLVCYNLKTFSKLSDIPFTDVFDVSKKSTCPEIIWQIVYKQGDVNYSSSLAANTQAKGETINSLFLSQGAGTAPTADLVKEFETGDIRTDYSIKYSANASVKNYFVTKFRDNSAAAGTLGYGGNDWILMRYADIILNLSEVYLNLGDNASAIQYLNMVRTRAGRPGYETMITDAAYAPRYPSLKLAILHERRVELAFEHHRWHDLLRFFSPVELVAYFGTKSQADYNNSPLTNITTKDYYFPIPLNEYKLNSEKMYQNPGY